MNYNNGFKTERKDIKPQFKILPLRKNSKIEEPPNSNHSKISMHVYVNPGEDKDKANGKHISSVEKVKDTDNSDALSTLQKKSPSPIKKFVDKVLYQSEQLQLIGGAKPLNRDLEEEDDQVRMNEDYDDSHLQRLSHSKKSNKSAQKSKKEDETPPSTAQTIGRVKQLKNICMMLQMCQDAVTYAQEIINDLDQTHLKFKQKRAMVQAKQYLLDQQKNINKAHEEILDQIVTTQEQFNFDSDASSDELKELYEMKQDEYKECKKRQDIILAYIISLQSANEIASAE